MNTYNPNLHEVSETETVLSGEVPSPQWVQFTKDIKDAFRQITLQSKTILNIDEAAELLHCAVSTLQTMPIDELPTYEGAGRYTYYLKSDLEEFVRKRRRTIKRGTGLGKRLNVIDHIPAAGVENPALEALKQL